jgi:hypothetical protein
VTQDDGFYDMRQLDGNDRKNARLRMLHRLHGIHIRSIGAAGVPYISSTGYAPEEQLDYVEVQFKDARRKIFFDVYKDTPEKVWLKIMLLV